MKIPLLLPICTLLLLISCKKSNPLTPQSSISATVDGVNETFNMNASATLTNIEGNNVLLISGKETSDTGIGIEVNSASTITKGTYPTIVGTPIGFDPATYVSYTQGFVMFFPAQNVASQNLITITYISSTNVQGTFDVALSGSLLSTTQPVFTNKTITNGKFNVMIKPSN